MDSKIARALRDFFDRHQGKVAAEKRNAPKPFPISIPDFIPKLYAFRRRAVEVAKQQIRHTRARKAGFESISRRPRLHVETRSF